jgi:hypothetical protein
MKLDLDYSVSVAALDTICIHAVLSATVAQS